MKEDRAYWAKKSGQRPWSWKKLGKVVEVAKMQGSHSSAETRPCQALATIVEYWSLSKEHRESMKYSL